MIFSSAIYLFQCLVIKPWIPIRIGIQPKMLDPDLYQMNTNPKHWKNGKIIILGKRVCGLFEDVPRPRAFSSCGRVQGFPLSFRRDRQVRKITLPIFLIMAPWVKYGVRSPKYIWAPVYSCTHWLIPRNSPPQLGSLVSQDRRHLFVTLNGMNVDHAFRFCVRRDKTRSEEKFVQVLKES